MRPANAMSTRARPTVLIGLAAVMFAGRLAAGINEGANPPHPGGLVSWRPIDGAVAAATAEHKPILYDFSASWCEPCREELSSLSHLLDRQGRVPISIVGVNVAEVPARVRRFLETAPVRFPVLLDTDLSTFFHQGGILTIHGWSSNPAWIEIFLFVTINGSGVNFKINLRAGSRT